MWKDEMTIYGGIMVFFETLFVGLLALLLGAAFCFIGYRFFRILIPIWGFFAGFFFGAQGVVSLFGGGFLATVTSWVIGLVVGLIFAALAYFFYYAAVVILGGSVGYWIGTGLIAAIGLSQQGFIAVIVGLVVGVALAILIIVLNLPKILIIVFSALGGSGTILAGILLLLNRIPLAYLGYGSVYAIIRNSWFWLIVWLVLAGAGMVVQWRSSQQYTLEWSQTM
jgi:hypothetical protein